MCYLYFLVFIVILSIIQYINSTSLIWIYKSLCQNSQNWIFIPSSKKGNAKECSNYHTIALISHFIKVMLKILQARLQQYVKCELPDVQAGFRNSRRTGDQVANIRWIIEKARKFQKNIYFCFIDYTKAFDYIDHNKLENPSRDRNTDHLSWLLRNLYANQEETIKFRHGTMDWFKLGKEYVEAVYCHPAYLTYRQRTSWNARLDEAQTGIKISRRNINNLRHTEDTTLMAESEEELNSLLIRWNRRVKKLA